MSTGTQGNGRYGAVAIALHWLIAVLIGLNYVAAWVADDMPKAAAAKVMGNHMAFGILILLLTVLRIVWRLVNRGPALLPMARWERILAHAVHGFLYLLMLAIPLAGWAMHSAFTGGQGVSIFGAFTFPGLPLAQDKVLAEHVFGAMHGLFATAMLVLMGLHVLGALKHQFVDKVPELQRVLPWG
ncbi:MAG: cytochrome b [Sphingomonadales bacterium]|nr:cytochrome b [Sphingomonadales bacterium]